jgi:hypothetical protein
VNNLYAYLETAIVLLSSISLSLSSLYIQFLILYSPHCHLQFLGPNSGHICPQPAPVHGIQRVDDRLSMRKVSKVRVDAFIQGKTVFLIMILTTHC